MTEVLIPRKFRGLFGDFRDAAYFGGRGSAKSHSIATALTILSAKKPLRIVCGREFQNSTRDSVKQLIEDKIKSTGLESSFQVLETEIRSALGGKFTFIGMARNPDAVKSLEGADWFWGEEANRFSRRSLSIIRPTIRKPGSRMVWSWNPDKETDPIDEMFRGGDPPPNSIVQEVNWMDNPFFPAELRAEMEHDYKRDPEMAGHVWGGKYRTQSQATVFRNWRVEEFETPANAVHRFGADWGFANDPTVIIRAHIVGREIRIDHCEAGVGVEIDATPAMFDKVPHARRWPICADSARPETISYMRRAGFKMVSAVKGPGSIEEGVRFLKAYDIVVHPRCDALLRQELENYSYKVDPLTEQVLPILEDRYNNTIDALRYACEVVRKAGKAKDEDTNKPKPRDYGLRRASEDNSWMTV